MSSFGSSPTQWEIFGGNAFILKISYPEESLFVAMIIKSIFRQVEDLDVELHIGLGEIEQDANTLRTAIGTALVLSKWNENEKIPKKPALVVNSNQVEPDHTINLLLEFALLNMNEWSAAEAEIVELCLLFPEKNQQELAEWLRIKQSAVSQRRARAHLDLLLKLDDFYRKKINAIKQ